MKQEDFRKAKPKDSIGVARLAERAYQHYVPVIGAMPLPMEVDYRAMIDEDEVWIAGPADNPFACLVLKPEPDHMLIWSIAIDPERQGNGFGRGLLQFAIQRAIELDLREVRLFTNVKMHENLKWYARYGFRETGREFKGDKEVVHMALSLESPAN